jgi:hypothetical protein
MKKNIVSIIIFLVSLPVYVLLIVIFLYMCIWLIPVETLMKVCRLNNLSSWAENIDGFFMKQIRKFSN